MNFYTWIFKKILEILEQVLCSLLKAIQCLCHKIVQLLRLIRLSKSICIVTFLHQAYFIYLIMKAVFFTVFYSIFSKKMDRERNTLIFFGFNIEKTQNTKIENPIISFEWRLFVDQNVLEDIFNDCD